MNSFVAGIAVVVAAAVTAAAGAVAVRRYVRFERNKDTTPLGTILTIVTGLHAVLVVFVLVSVIQMGDMARQATSREADNLVAAVWAADALPVPVQTQVRADAHAYADIVVGHEWPRLRAGEPVDQQGWSALQQLRHTIAEAPVATEQQRDRQTEASDRVVDTYLARQARLSTTQAGVTPMIWFVLVVGTAASIGLPYLFGATKAASYAFLVATVAAVLTMLLFAISQLQNPFADAGTASIDPMRLAMDRLAGDL